MAGVRHPFMGKGFYMSESENVSAADVEDESLEEVEKSAPMDEEAKQLEIRKLAAETKLLEAERRKAEEEADRIVADRPLKWAGLKVTALAQAVIAGIVAAFLISGFALDHFLKITELNKKLREALEQEKTELTQKAGRLEAEKEQLEQNRDALARRQEDSRQTIISLQEANKQTEQDLQDAVQRLAQIAPQDCSEEELQSEIASLRSQLETLEQQSATRGRELSEGLRELAQEREETSNAVGETWFPVIASPYNESDLRGKLEELGVETIRYPIHVYKTTDKSGNPVFAITLGGYLSKEEALSRVEYARESKLSPDAYPWSSTNWGSNVFDKY